jgi:hypothetical protein
MSLIWAFLLYWLVLFAACFIVVEYGQGFLYDEATSYVWPRVAVGSLLLALLLTYTHTSFDSMLTTDIGWTVLQSIVWFGVFTLIFRFQPQHGAVVGVVTMLLITGLATMAVDSLGQTIRPVEKEKIRVFDPKTQGLRKSMPAPAAPASDAKKAEPAAP